MQRILQYARENKTKYDYDLFWLKQNQANEEVQLKRMGKWHRPAMMSISMHNLENVDRFCDAGDDTNELHMDQKIDNSKSD